MTRCSGCDIKIDLISSLSACKTIHDQPDMQSNVEMFITLPENSGLDISQYSINCFAFVPNLAGYVCVLQRNDGLTRCAWRDVPTSLDNHLIHYFSDQKSWSEFGSGGVILRADT